MREKVLRFRNHPCIAIWCGRNESDPAPKEIDDDIQKIMAELDPSRGFIIAILRMEKVFTPAVRITGKRPEAYYTVRKP